MRIMFLSGDRETARAYRIAADETGALRLITVNHIAKALEQMFREPFDALLSDDPNVFHPRIQNCRVLWPGTICLLLREPIGDLRLPDELTFCFSYDSDPKQVLRRMLSFPAAECRTYAAEALISRFLQQVGVPVSLTGFECMREAIGVLLSVNRFTDIGSLQELYGFLGAKLQIGASAAEHAIRQGINAAWIRADTGLLEKIFGYTVDAERATPSNAAFLFRAADHIKLQQRGNTDK